MEPITQQHLTDEILSAWLDGYLSEAESLLADQHLGSCRACAARYAGLRSLRDALRHLDAVPLPRDFRLTPAGRPQTPSRPRSVPPRGAGPWVAARAISATVTFAGVLLLAISLLMAGITSQTANRSAASQVQTTSGAANAPLPTTTCQVHGCDIAVQGAQPTATWTVLAPSTGVTRGPQTPGAVGAGNGTPSATTIIAVQPTPTGLPDDLAHNNGSTGQGVQSPFTASPAFSALLGLALALVGAAGLLLSRRR